MVPSWLQTNKPSEPERESILSDIICKLNLEEGSFDLKELARSTAGYLNVDFEGVAKLAGWKAIARANNERKRELSEDGTKELPEDWYKKPWAEKDLEKLAIKMSDFKEAIKGMQPSLQRIGYWYSAIPDVKWEDAGGLDAVKDELEGNIVNCIRFPMVYELAIKLDVQEQLGRVFVVAATDRPHLMDPSIFKHGRLQKLYVPLPTPSERVSILKALVTKRKMPLDASVDLGEIGRDTACEGFSDK